MILKKLGKPESLISFVTDRLGPDRRYTIDSSFAQRELKWIRLQTSADRDKSLIQARSVSAKRFIKFASCLSDGINLKIGFGLGSR
jgi:dTDP-D-glucose 4,6-dehydratase